MNQLINCLSRLIILPAFGFFSLVTGCLHLPAARNDQIKIVPALNQPKTESLPLLIANKTLAEKSSYSVKELILQPANNTQSLMVEYYEPKTSGQKRAIIILPIAGGIDGITRYFARGFAKNNFVAVIIHRQKELPAIKDITEIDSALKQSISNHQSLIDWLISQPTIASNQLGIFGVSLGGIEAVLLAAKDQRLKAVVIGLAGQDLPYILTHSKESMVIQYRQKFQQKENLSLAELEEKLRQTLTYEPANYAGQIACQKTLLILAGFDQVVPFTKGWELRRQLGQPKTIILPTGHYSAILYLPYIKSVTLRFFEKKLEF